MTTESHYIRRHLGLFFLVLSGLGILLLMASCSPAKRMGRLLKKHPELLKTDTVYKNVEVTVPPITIHDSIPVPKTIDSGTVDSILKLCAGMHIQPIEVTKARIRNVIQNQKCLQDTIKGTDTSGVVYRIYQKGQEIHVEIHRLPKKIEVRTKVPVEKITVGDDFPIWKWAVAIAIGIIIGIFISLVAGPFSPLEKDT